MIAKRSASGFISFNLATQNREAALLRATTDIFAHSPPHDRDGIRRYEELASHFLSKAALADRAHVAESLADRADAPPSILRVLARDVIEVARPVLERSPALAALDLLTVIGSTGRHHHRIIAQRGDLPADVETALRLAGDRDTISILERQRRWRVNDDAGVWQDQLAEAPSVATNDYPEESWATEASAPSDPAENEAFDGSTEEAIPSDPEPIFAADDEPIPTEPEIPLPLPDDELMAVADSPANPDGDAGGDAPNAEPSADAGRLLATADRPGMADAFLALAPEERLRVIGKLSDDGARPPANKPQRRLDQVLRMAYRTQQIVGFARSRQTEQFVEALAEAADLDAGIVRRMLDDPSGEPMVLLLRALGLPKEDANQVLLLANPVIGEAVRAFFRLADLYAGMETGVAETLVASWRAPITKLPPAHMPQYIDAPGARREQRDARHAPDRAVEPARRVGER